MQLEQVSPSFSPALAPARVRADQRTRRHLRLAEAAQACGFSVSTLRRARDRGSLKCERVGGLWFVSEHELHRWVTGSMPITLDDL